MSVIKLVPSDARSADLTRRGTTAALRQACVDIPRSARVLAHDLERRAISEGEGRQAADTVGANSNGFGPSPFSGRQGPPKPGTQEENRCQN